MKLLALALGALSLSLAPVAHAQYFSEGWTPGASAPAPAATTTSAGYTPGAPIPPAPTQTKTGGGFALPTRIPTLRELSDMLELSNLLTAAPVAALAERFGINVTERLAAAQALRIWDERVPLITDGNYQSLVVDEVMTPEEEAARAWFVVITVTASTPEGISKFTDNVFDSAFNLTQEAGDLPHVRWGRIDYLNVTQLTTKWNVWSAPYIMVITNRGKDLRFWKATQVRLNEETIRTFLKEEGWRNTPPWKSSFGPGGEREWIMDYFAKSLTYSYNGMLLLPKWMLYMITGALGSLMIGLLHRADTKPKPQATAVAPKGPAPPAVAPEAASASGTPKKKGKKNGKK